jgi:hypothetical protein
MAVKGSSPWFLLFRFFLFFLWYLFEEGKRKETQSKPDGGALNKWVFGECNDFCQDNGRSPGLCCLHFQERPLTRNRERSGRCATTDEDSSETETNEILTTMDVSLITWSKPFLRPSVWSSCFVSV